MNLTIIDNKSMRGILAPAAVLPKETLEDIIDLVELSTTREARKTATRLKTTRDKWQSIAVMRPKQ